MVGAQVQLALLVAAVAANCLLTYYIYRRMAAEWAATPPSTEAAADADRVACRDCGVPNDAEYRFCRSCVAELPGGGTGTAERSNPFERAT